jgi:hypothetical protein
LYQGLTAFLFVFSKFYFCNGKTTTNIFQIGLMHPFEILQTTIINVQGQKQYSNNVVRVWTWNENAWIQISVLPFLSYIA